MEIQIGENPEYTLSVFYDFGDGVTKRRTAAISRSQIAKQAKPMGELVSRMREAKEKGKDPYSVIPPPPPAPKKKRKKRQSKETSLVRECLIWLKEHHIFAYRQNTGTLWVGNQSISYGCKGSGDITGMLPNGVRLEIECKSPIGKQSRLQKEFQRIIEQNNGVYLLVRQVEDLECLLSI